MILPTTAASCGALTIENSNHGDGNHIGVTGDTADVTCADGYIGPKTIVTCTADVSAAGVSFWSPMPTCAGAFTPHRYRDTSHLRRSSDSTLPHPTGCLGLALDFALSNDALASTRLDSLAICDFHT